MGLVKNKMMEMQDNGDWPNHDLADKYVCTCHFEDKYLNEIIQSHGKQGTCSYCGKQSVVCDMKTLCEQIVWKIGLYYQPLDNAEIVYAVEHPEETGKIGKEGHKLTEKEFNCDYQAKRIIGIFKEKF